MSQYLPIDEAHPLQPKDAYGASKAAMVLYTVAFARRYGLRIALLWFPTIVSDVRIPKLRWIRMHEPLRFIIQALSGTIRGALLAVHGAFPSIHRIAHRRAKSCLALLVIQFRPCCSPYPASASGLTPFLDPEKLPSPFGTRLGVLIGPPSTSCGSINGAVGFA